MAGYESVLEALESRDLVRPSWGGVIAALCPSHEDSSPSLSLKEGDDGRALLFCHAGCDVREVVNALDLSMSDLFRGSDTGAVVDVYPYFSEAGVPLYRVVRLSPKGFFQERWEDGEWKPGLREVDRVLYRLPEVMAGIDAPLYVSEGEKDAEALVAAGVNATTLLGGANKWRDEYLPYFQDRDVIIVGDKDEAGRLHVDTLRSKLGGTARSVRVLFPAFGKDVSDHLAAGLSLDQLVQDEGGLDEFGPLDWNAYESPDTEWLLEPYLPRGGRVLAFGPAGSLKSLWAMWAAAHLAKEGKRVAYFSLEMLVSDTAKRIRSLNPPKENFYLFTKDLKLGNPDHTAKLIAGLQNFDLIVIDSWSAARAGTKEWDDTVAQLDVDTFLPLIEQTGATILLLDNTGHDSITDSGKIKADHARGSSAKGDKMEVTLWFRRPFEDNNYRTTLTVKKMRLDYPMPEPLTIETPQDRIEFYGVYEAGDIAMIGSKPAWPGMYVEPEPSYPEGDHSLGSGPPPSVSVPQAPEPVEMTSAERRALARLKDKFKVLEVHDGATA